MGYTTVLKQTNQNNNSEESSFQTQRHTSHVALPALINQNSENHARPTGSMSSYL